MGDVQSPVGSFLGSENVEEWMRKTNILDDKSKMIYDELRQHVDSRTGTVHGEAGADPYRVLAYLRKPTKNPPLGTESFLKQYAHDPNAVPVNIVKNRVNVSSPYIESSPALSEMQVEFRDYMELVNKMDSDQLNRMIKQMKKLPVKPTLKQRDVMNISLSERMRLQNFRSTPKKFMNKMKPEDFIRFLKNVNKAVKDTH